MSNANLKLMMTKGKKILAKMVVYVANGGTLTFHTHGSDVVTDTPGYLDTVSMVEEHGNILEIGVPALFILLQPYMERCKCSVVKGNKLQEDIWNTKDMTIDKDLSQRLLLDLIESM
ncbi:MAG: hypothetical protein ACRDDY_14125 [Clostridium sp.]|uniref:hypothetical protein n=1 Tax=Clostridium sp. TaxID=1506 RepID=UPI003EE652FD